jgi:hypothetical protein
MLLKTKENYCFPRIVLCPVFVLISILDVLSFSDFMLTNSMYALFHFEFCPNKCFIYFLLYVFCFDKFFVLLSFWGFMLAQILALLFPFAFVVSYILYVLFFLVGKYFGLGAQNFFFFLFEILFLQIFIHIYYR